MEALTVSARSTKALAGGRIGPGDKFRVDKAVVDAAVEDYDGLILPGATINPDKLRQDPEVISLVQAFFLAGKPVGAICHGPWTLVEADLVTSRNADDLPAFCAKLVEEFAEGLHDVAPAGATAG